jgi:hypothetical protein
LKERRNGKRSWQYSAPGQLYYLFAGQSAEKMLNSWKAWLVANNATVMFILLLVLGMLLLGQGLGGLIG